jgi:hypothetical protein
VPRGASIDGVDPQFPYENAAIGVTGYDIRSDVFIPPEAPDIMAYCDSPWFSDYTYAGLLNTVRSVNQVQQTVIVDPERIGEFWVRAVEGGTPTRWLRPRPGVVMAEGVASPADVLDANGQVVDTIVVYKNVISDIDAFTLDVPAPPPGWHALHVHGVGLMPF